MLVIYETRLSAGWALSSVDTPYIRLVAASEKSIAIAIIMSPNIGVTAAARLAGADIGVLSYERVEIPIRHEHVDDVRREMVSGIVNLHKYQLHEEDSDG